MDEDKRRDEVRALLSEKAEPLERVMALIFDGKQYSVRIPREFTDILKLDKKKHKFKFRLTLPSPLDEAEEARLEGELVSDEGKTA